MSKLATPHISPVIKLEMYSDYDGVWVAIDAPSITDRRRFDTAIEAKEFLKQWLDENYWRC